MNAISESMIKLADEMEKDTQECYDEGHGDRVYQLIIKSAIREIRSLASIVEEQTEKQKQSFPMHSIMGPAVFGARGPINPEELAQKEAQRILQRNTEEAEAVSSAAFLVGGPLNGDVVQLDQSQPKGTRTRIAGHYIYEKQDDGSWKYVDSDPLKKEQG